MPCRPDESSAHSRVVCVYDVLRSARAPTGVKKEFEHAGTRVQGTRLRDVKVGPLSKSGAESFGLKRHLSVAAPQSRSYFCTGFHRKATSFHVHRHTGRVRLSSTSGPL